MKNNTQFITAFLLTMLFNSVALANNLSSGNFYRTINPESYSYAESSTLHDDGSDASSWDIYDNNPEGTVSTINVSGHTTDNHIIKLKGDGRQTGYRLVFDTPSIGTEFIKQWSMKYSESYTIYISCQTKDGHRYLYYTAAEEDLLVQSGNNRYIHHGLGNNTKNGNWTTIRKNLQQDLKEAQPDNDIISIDAFLIRGSGYIDDLITLSYADFDNDLIPDEIELSVQGLNYDDPSDAKGDIDNDGLDNINEIIIGTDISNTDTDQDGLNDLFEAIFSPLNPLINDIDDNNILDGEDDYDEDGFNNIDEQTAGTDPFSVSFLAIGDYIYDIIRYFKDGNIENWTVYDNDPDDTEISSTTDLNGTGNQVARFTGDGTKNGYKYLFPSVFYVNRYRNPVIYWTMKYTKSYTVYISCQTKEGHRYLNYTASDTNSLSTTDNDRYIHHGLGKNTKNGKWHTVQRNLNADLKDGQTNNTILSIDAFLIRGNGYIGEIGMYSYKDDDSDMLPDMVEDNLGMDLSPNDDLDSDGLSNCEEIKLGTNLSNPDTDGDGLSDGYERLSILTDPVDTDNSADDPDNDGFSNIEEMNAGTNPLEYTFDGVGGYTYEKTVHNSGEIVTDWDIYDNDPEGAEIKRNESPESSDSYPVQLLGDGRKNGYRLSFSKPLIIDSNSVSGPIVSWMMKYSEPYTIYISCQTEHGHRYIYYTASATDNLEQPGNSRYIHHGLDLETKNGEWHTIRRNLQKDLNDAQPNNKILSVNAFLIRGSGYVKEVATLSATR